MESGVKRLLSKKPTAFTRKERFDTPLQKFCGEAAHVPLARELKSPLYRLPLDRDRRCQTCLLPSLLYPCVCPQQMFGIFDNFRGISPPKLLFVFSRQKRSARQLPSNVFVLCSNEKKNATLFTEEMATSHEDSFSVLSAPRYVDFNKLEVEDSGNISAWFDTHEATVICSPSKQQEERMRKKKQKRKQFQQKETSTRARASKVRSASLSRPALHPVVVAPQAAEKIKPVREVRRRPASYGVPKKDVAPAGERIDCGGKDRLDKIIMEKFEEKRRALLISQQAAPFQQFQPSAQEEEEEEDGEGENRAELVGSETTTTDPSQWETTPQNAALELPAACRTQTVSSAPPLSTAAAALALLLDRQDAQTEKPGRGPSHLPRQINGRMMGKQAPVIKRLQQQREQRLQNEMSKQRERAKAQREQHRARARKTEETKKQQDAEREHKTKEKKDKAEKVKRQREREQEKKREKERQEAEKREQKQARFDEKKHLKDLSSDNKVSNDTSAEVWAGGLTWWGFLEYSSSSSPMI